MEKKDLEQKTDKELNLLLKARGLNPLAHEDRETAISILLQL